MEKQKTIAKNKKASYEYFFLETYDCGIVLRGTEIKSIRKGAVSITEAYCQVKNGELYILDMHIAKYTQGNIFNHDELRPRKLLAHKREIRSLEKKVALEGLTIIPLEIYLQKGLAKMKIALAKGKKTYDKREDLKRKDLNLEARRELKRK